MKIRMLHPAVGEFSFPIDPGGQAILGRRGADVEITWDRRISRRHARIWADGTRLFYEDLGSRNGSFIGSDRLSGTVELNPGMSVLLGETALLVPDSVERPDFTDHEQTFEAPAADLGLPADAAGTHDLPAIQDIPIDSQDLPTMAPRPAEGLEPIPTLLSQDLGLPSSSGATDDMPRDDAPTKAPETFVEEAQRRYPRLVGNRLAQVELSHREELRQLWVRDISKGGVFIETNEPPPTGTRLEVRLKTPDGAISLHGLVVHVVEAASAERFKMPPGVGLQFVDLNPENRRSIQEYVDGLKAKLTSELAPYDNISSEEIDLLVVRARQFLLAAEEDQLYKALDIETTASFAAIDKKVKELQDALSQALRGAPPPQQARLQAAQGVLKRVGRLMTNEQSRLEYDFRHGHIRAKERLANAHSGTGPSLEILRRTWNRVSHERVDQAALLTRRAFAARQAKRWDDAIRFAKQALKLNPFFEELEKTLEAWELAARAELSPTFPRRAPKRTPPPRSRSVARS